MSLREFEIKGGSACLTWCFEQPLPDVWRHLIDPEHLPEWLGTVTQGRFAEDETIVVDHGDGYLCRSDIVSFEPETALVMTWDFPDEPTSRLRVSLSTALTGSAPSDPKRSTVLRLHHAELGDLAGEYLAGWITHLTFFEASLSGAPLPAAAFWALCGTNVQLTRR